MSQFRHKVTRMAGFYNCLIFWNGYILFTVYEVFVGRLVCSVILLYQLHWNVYILFIVRASTLVSFVNALCGTKFTGMYIFSLLWVWSFLVDWFVL